MTLYLSIALFEFTVKSLQKAFIIEDTIRDCRMKLVFYKSLLDKDIEFYDKFKPGEVLNRFNDDFWSLYHLGPENLLSILILLFKLIASSATLFMISKELFFLHTILFGYEIFKNYSDVMKQMSLWNPYSLID